MPLTRRGALVRVGAAAALPAWSAHADAVATPRVLRYAFAVAETGFDPVQVSDLYSRICTAHVFETMLGYDHLARPFRLQPCVAEAMPEVADDYRTFTFRLRPGILYADDPVFRGRPRELVAADFVYSLKRHYDPKYKNPNLANLDDQGIIGLAELRRAAQQAGGRYDYDQPVEGLQALDRYTLRVRLRESRPRHLFMWAAPDVYGAVAREVVEGYGDKIMEHPVGTGPYRLAEWRRSSRLVFVRNERYRDVRYDAEPAPDDAEGRAVAERLRGRRLPMVDKVEIAIIEESQPRWLAFLNREQNFLERLPNEYAPVAVPGGRIAPHLARRGVQSYRVLGADITTVTFNMEDPLIGGYTPDKVALRRAIVLGNDVQREIRDARYGQAIPAQSLLRPQTIGYRADLRTEMGVYDPARAKALLDLYGYVDRDGDGWRERPDGSPLTLELRTQGDSATRQLDELWKKDVDALGLKVELKNAQWPENLKATQSGHYMIWRVGYSAPTPDGQQALELAYGPSAGKINLARFRLPAFDKLYDALRVMTDGPERQAAFDAATRLVVAYAPYRVGVHRVLTDLAYPEVIGYRRPACWQGWWPYVDVQSA
ncbi:MAG: bicyclomycin resistance protein [Proteobacteria bacterium]|nr:bicyclomycin resistance protein [Pseudomonadota bacterium]